MTTESAQEDARWFQRVLPVSGLVLALVALAALVSPSVRDQVSLSASHQPQQYVELYFARSPAGTQLVCTTAGGRVRVSFAVTSHLQDQQDLAYVVSVGHERRTGSTTVEPGATTRVDRSVARPAGREFDVAVRLPGQDQQLRAHCPGGTS